MLVGGTGVDTLYGGTGVDTASYAGAAGTMNVNLTTGLALGSDAGAAGERLYEVENLIGSAYRDLLYGNSWRQHPGRRRRQRLAPGLRGQRHAAGRQRRRHARRRRRDRHRSTAATALDTASYAGATGTDERQPRQRPRFRQRYGCLRVSRLSAIENRDRLRLQRRPLRQHRGQHPDRRWRRRRPLRQWRQRHARRARTATTPSTVAPGSTPWIGGAGDDVLVRPRRCRSTLLGGAGADRFVWNADCRWALYAQLGGSLHEDVVLDFTRGSDKIDLSALDTDLATARRSGLDMGWRDETYWWPSHPGR